MLAHVFHRFVERLTFEDLVKMTGKIELVARPERVESAAERSVALRLRVLHQIRKRKNTGSTAADATDNVVITDTFDPRLSNITVTYNGTVWTDPANYTYDEATGLFTTASGAVTVPAAEFAQDPATGNWVIDPGTAVITVTGTI